MAKKTEFAPMLAAKTPDAGFKYKFPLIVSPKLDGIRAIVKDGVVLSRALKPIPNKHVQKLFGLSALNGLDGELIVGPPVGRDENGDDVMQRTTKGVMRIEGEPDVRYHLFDMWDRPEQPFWARLIGAHSFIQPFHELPLYGVEHVAITGVDSMDAFEAMYLAMGFEGAMLRDPNGSYKFGRSTAKEGGLIKVKRFEDAEATVIGVERKFHNANEATVDELGHTKRSTHQAGKVGLEELGALICKTPEGVEFNIGTGFTQAQREALWKEGAGSLIGKLVKYKSFTAAGVKDAPRFPVFLSFRDPIDL